MDNRNSPPWSVTILDANPKEKLRRLRNPPLVTGHGTCVWCRSDGDLVAENGATHRWLDDSCPDYQASLSWLQERASKKSYKYRVDVFHKSHGISGIDICSRKFREVFNLSKKEMQTIQKHARKQDVTGYDCTEDDTSRVDSSIPTKKESPTLNDQRLSVVEGANKQKRDHETSVDSSIPKEIIVTITSSPVSQLPVVRTQLLEHFLWEDRSPLFLEFYQRI